MDTPRFGHDRPALAAVAAYLHQQRVVGYPELIAASKLSQAATDRALRISNAIAADWAAIVAYAPAPDWLTDPKRGGAFKWERVDTLNAMAIRTRTAADVAPEDERLCAIADCVDALLWWEGRQPSARWLADMTIELRARAATERAARLPASLGAAA